jgi:hypothetical protein
MQRRTTVFLLICAFILLSTTSWIMFARWQTAEAPTALAPTLLKTNSSVNRDHGKQLSTMSQEISATKKYVEPARHEMLERFNRSQSYRAFIYEALKHPELGGHEYAQQALIRCRKFPLPSPAPLNSDTLKTKAIAALTMRCDMTKEEKKELSDHLFSGRIDAMIGKMKDYELAHPGTSYTTQKQEDFLRTEDPLNNLLQALQKPDATRGEKSAAIRNILASEEPFLLQMIFFQSEQISAGQESPQRGIFFLGNGTRSLIQNCFFLTILLCVISAWTAAQLR